MRNTKPCHFFGKPGGCRFGAACKFSHPDNSPKSSGSAQRSTGNASSGKKPQRETSNSETEFRKWRFMVPKDGESASPLGPQLSKFFQKSLELVTTDAGTRQDVMSRLASAGGRLRIQELIDQDLSTLTGTMKVKRFMSQHVPFFEAIANQDVLSSIILEQPVGELFTFVYGLNGRRAVKLFSLTAEVLLSLPEQNQETVSQPITHLFEVAFLVLAKVIDSNGGAQINPEIPAIVETFSAALDKLIDLQGDAVSYKARKYLSRMQQRLGIGQAIPALGEKAKAPIKPASFVLSVDPPGHLSHKGPRHDNDHEDIGRIAVLPTWQEVQSLRAEYLPTKDAETWHKPGIDGLLDRHFRLLREDTVGQLRDVIQSELARLQDPQNHTTRVENGRQGLRSYTYHNVSFTDISVNRRDGLRCEIAFPQPQHIRGMNPHARAEWWTNSRRLQSDALVCLVDNNALLLFCSVVFDTPKTQANERRPSTTPPNLRTLHSDSNESFLTLKVVDYNDKSAGDLLQRLWGSHQVILVEFPGVLLPAFQPTLEALQQMSKSKDVPFSEFLAPADQTGGVVHVPPPAYARSPNFRFDLGKITNAGNDLHLSTESAFDINTLVERSTLDATQAHAVVDSLSRNFALIQGPPGTGKSYTGIALIKVLLDNRLAADLGPIVCVCYTNHALDQLLEHLVHAGVDKIIRIGSRSKSEVLQPLMLRTVARRMEGTKSEKRLTWEVGSQLEKDELEIKNLITALSTADSWSSIKEYLFEHYLYHHDQLFGGGGYDDSGWQEVGHGHSKKALPHWLRGGAHGMGGPERTISVLERTSLTQMSNGERQKLFHHWVQVSRGQIKRNLVIALQEYNERRTDYQHNRLELDLRCLQQAHIIGVTTSGLARNLDLLRRIRAKVMVCEEAGEVLESHTLTAMLPSVEHAILIGDHLQLRPQIQRYDLGREHPHGEQYSLDVSLFERLVQPNDASAVQLPFTTLETQRRMHPLVSQLVRNTLYPALKDAQSTTIYPGVTGMKQRLFWFDHTVFEANSDGPKDAVSTSRTNDFEIEMTLGLVSHLMKQGVYEAEDIAVLTPYLGQLQKLRRRLGSMWELVLNDRDADDLEKAGLSSDELPQVNKALPHVTKTSALNALKVATVDNFQGEEAKVVVISLVRSNEKNNCGFLKTSNRINVLLSRAQHGMFIIGNSETASSVSMWADVLDMLRTGGHVGTFFELQCPRHPESPIEIHGPEDFSQFSPEGGCNRKCDKRLRCGHSCITKCHSSLLHDAVKCLEPCSRPMNGCDHSCPRVCGEKCPEKCTVTVHDASRVLPCGHAKQKLPCWQAQDISTVLCKVKVQRIIPGCQHKVELACHIDYKDDSFQCTARCDEKLQCGHSCKSRCHKCKTRQNGAIVEENHGICEQTCGRNYSTCRHSCTAKCHGDKPCPLCNAPCEIFCSHSRCNKKCHEPCSPCAEHTCASACPHSQCTLPCAAPCDWLPCSKRCEKLLHCGHQCPSLCGEACPDVKFCQVCGSDSVKDMQVDFIEMLTYKEVNLDEDTCLFPSCGHIMTVANMDGHMDVAKHYELSPEGTISGLKPAPPFSNDELKACPTCRGPIRNMSRYGRIVRRALLDESTKKFILWSHAEFVELQGQFQKEYDQLTSTIDDIADTITPSFTMPTELRIEGETASQLNSIGQTAKDLGLAHRYREIFKLRIRIHAHTNKVQKEEQPFQRVHDFCEDVRRRGAHQGASPFPPDASTALQTRAHLLATTLLLRTDLALLSDLTTAFRTLHPSLPCSLNLHPHRVSCIILHATATAAHAPRIAAEATLIAATLAALERPAPDTNVHTIALAYLNTAGEVCAEAPAQTVGIPAEIETVRKMLNTATFFSPVTSAEQRQVVRAMAAEMRGTGHWYYCANGHPFTVGECGAPMEETGCPQCGARVGGRSHESAEGVRRAEDLEGMLNLGGLEI